MLPQLPVFLTIATVAGLIATGIGFAVSLDADPDPELSGLSANRLVGSGGGLDSEELTWAEQDVVVASPYHEDGSQAAPRTETTVAINPTDPDNIIAGAIDFNWAQPGPPCCTRGWWNVARYVSDDGGSTWTDQGFGELLDRAGAPLDCDEAVGADPSVTFDGNGVAYFSYIGYGCPTGGSLAVQTSGDGGHTWNAAVLVQGIGEEIAPNLCASLDKPHIGADRVNNIVYVAWVNILRECEATEDPPELGWAIHYSKTTDGGATWSAPARVSASLDDGAQGALPRVGPDGTVYVVYHHLVPYEIGDCPSVVRIIDGSGLHATEMVVARSKDQGATWTHHPVAKLCDSQFTTVEHPLALGNALALPGLAIDQTTGTLFLTWSDRRVPSPTVVVTTSNDQAETWTDPVLIEALGKGNFIPWLAHADGAAHRVYLSEASTGAYDVLHQTSADGAAWSEPFILNSAPLCACWANINGPYKNNQWIGHYIGMDAEGGVVVPIWADNRDPLVTQTAYARIGTYGTT